MVDDPRVTLARKHEREARYRLEEGCAADLASMELLFAATLTVARRQLHEALATPRADLKAASDLVVSASVRRLHDSANIRFRARFRNYSEAVWQSEANLLAPPRRVALPHLDLEAPALEPLAAPEKLHVDAWLSALGTALREGLRSAVDAARGKVIRRVIGSIARARALSRTRSTAD